MPYWVYSIRSESYEDIGRGKKLVFTFQRALRMYSGGKKREKMVHLN